MRLYEIQEGDAGEQRVKRLKANAQSAKDRAKQMKAQADASGEQLKMRQSRQKFVQLRKDAARSMLKPSA